MKTSIQLNIIQQFLQNCFATCVLVTFSYLCHQKIQAEYYAKCNADIIQVIFFRNSHFCTLLRTSGRIFETYIGDVIDAAVAVFAP